MEHVAIMKKSWGLTQKILARQKKIESRWYVNRFAPWDKVKPGEIIYFKDSGGPIIARAQVSKVEQFADLNSTQVEKILRQHHTEIGIRAEDLESYIERFKDKRYCILAYLTNPLEVEPFYISKKGLASASAWICVKDVSQIKRAA